jgi:hypothetical protein
MMRTKRLISRQPDGADDDQESPLGARNIDSDSRTAARLRTTSLICGECERSQMVWAAAGVGLGSAREPGPPNP